MNFINKDITSVTHGIVCHQVNCQGVMGAGVALAIRKKWPIVYDVYKQAHKTGHLWLGNVIFAQINPSLIVANLCGQSRYGRVGIFTDYKALDQAISEVSRTSNLTGLIPVYFPEHMGCGLAGANWGTVINIIKKHIPDATICFKPSFRDRYLPYRPLNQ